MRRYLLHIFFAICTLISCSEEFVGYTDEEVMSVSVERISLGCDGGKATIEVEALCSWQISTSETWVHTSIKQGASGRVSFVVSVDENKTVSRRYATIRIENRNYNVIRTVPVQQEAGSAFINIADKELSFASAASSKSIKINSNIDYTITSSQSWCKVNKSSGTSGETTLEISVEANYNIESRSATIKVESKTYNKLLNIEINQSAALPGIELSASAISISSEGGSASLVVMSSIPWTASCDADWIELSSTSGNKGSSTIAVEASIGSTETSRSAVITISNAEYEITKEVNISQAKFVPELNIGTTSISATSDSATKSVSITSNISWKATSSASWVTLSSSSGSSGTTTLKLTTSANTATSSRSATVTITNSEYNITKTIKVTQAAFSPSLTTSLSSISAVAEGETKSITITSNISWKATSSVSWVTLSSSSGAKGSSTLKLTISANTTTSSRSATVTITNSEYNITKTIKVTQAAFSPSLTTSLSSISAVAEGETKSVTITSNISWKATSSASWVTLSSSSGSSGTTTLKLTTSANTATSSRSATVTITNSDYGITREISVYQSGFSVNFSISSTSITAAQSGGTFSITITSNISWQASLGNTYYDGSYYSSGASWVKLSQSSGSSGTTTLKITIDSTLGNIYYNYKSTELTIYNSTYGVSKTITIKQSI